MNLTVVTPTAPPAIAGPAAASLRALLEDVAARRREATPARTGATTDISARVTERKDAAHDGRTS